MGSTAGLTDVDGAVLDNGEIERVRGQEKARAACQTDGEVACAMSGAVLGCKR